ncbi:MAG TPA: FAD-binding oxidoreductase [Jatrophihabitans sp.]|nr:FAD-binding oxidoreductase [Jatrophihabitans sp.]
MTRTSVAVVGAGVVGAAVARQLAGSGCAVTLIDTHLPAIGASAYSAGILRRHHSLPADAELASRSLRFYRDFERLVGGTAGYTPRGFLVIVAPRFAGALERNRAVLDALGTPTEPLDADALGRRFPELKLAGDELGVYEADGGYGSAYSATWSLRSAATAAGAALLTGVRVEELAPVPAGWRLATNLGPLAFDQVVLAAGAAAGGLAGTAGIRLALTPRRIGLAVIDSAPDSSLPVCIDDVTGTYFVPRADGSTAVGVRARPECEQILPAEPLTAAEIAEALERGAGRVPRFAAAEPRGSQAACDGYTPDGRPLLGPVAGHPGLHLACGFSGGGFKTAPAVAELVAGAVLTGDVPELLATYSADRFDAGRPLRSETAYVHL